MSEIVPLRPGDPPRIGAFRLAGRLGENVYLGEGEPETRVVVRLLDPDLDTEFFLGAIEPLRGISGFCTARIVETGTLGDRPYVVSEYIEGDTLQEAVQRGERLRGAALHRFAVGTMTALTAIHQAGVVHGDIRPGNVILGPDGPRVIDAGQRSAAPPPSGPPWRRRPIVLAAASVAAAAPLPTLSRGPMRDTATRAWTVPETSITVHENPDDPWWVTAYSGERPGSRRGRGARVPPGVGP